MVALGERAVSNGQELLAEFIQYGHQKPFEEIVRRYAGMVFNVCFRITKDKHEAEDAVQAVFLTLALQAKRGADIKALGPWLQQVARRLALDSRRSKKRRKTREERHHAEQTVRRESLLDEALPSADMDELKTILHEELQKLPAKYRMPLILHYFGGLSRDEMAAELNCKPSTLGVRIFRGREMLAGRLSGRGIHISAAALAAFLGYAIKRAVSDALIASTSRAATAMLAGHDGAGMASAHVIGLTRRATNAVAIGKVKIAAVTLLLAGTSLGAGAKALQLLPKIDVQQLLSNQIKRLMEPLFSPMSRPLLSQASVTKAPVESAGRGSIADYVPAGATARNETPKISLPKAAPVKAPVSAILEIAKASEDSGKPIWAPTWENRASVAATAVPPAAENPQASPAAVVAADDSSASGYSGAGGGGVGGAGASVSPALTAVPARSLIGNAASDRDTQLALSINNLVVGSASTSSASTRSASLSAISATAVLLVPSTNGTVTESSAGQVRGWGTIQRTGTLVNNGQVVADGNGIDRTLNLTAFTAIETATINASPAQTATAIGTSAISAMGPVVYSAQVSNRSIDAVAAVSGTSSTGQPSGQTSSSIAGLTGAAGMAALVPGTIHPPTNGWYAVDHGRLCLSLESASAHPSELTWGGDPNAAVLTLTNSVRLTVDDASAAPADLSLLAPERSDLPNLSQITGATIGLWKVDSSSGELGGEVADADLTICYDDLLANALGASQDSVELWTLNAPTGSWQQVDPGTFALDTVDHLVYGSAEDFSYFAVSATPAPGADIQFIRAHQLSVVNDGDSAASASAITAPPTAAGSVPEPAGLALLAIGTGLLGRRRRRTQVG